MIFYDDGQMISGWLWPRFSLHLSFVWGKTPEKPHLGNLSRSGIEPGPAAWQARMLLPSPQRWTVVNKAHPPRLWMKPARKAGHPGWNSSPGYNFSPSIPQQFSSYCVKFWPNNLHTDKPIGTRLPLWSRGNMVVSHLSDPGRVTFPGWRFSGDFPQP